MTQDRHLTDDRIHAFIRAHVDFVLFALERSAESPLAEDFRKHATIALTFNQESGPHWRRLASWVLANVRGDDLTPTEREMRTMATRLEDSMMRAATGLSLSPANSERAYKRALNEMRPYLKPKETVQ